MSTGDTRRMEAETPKPRHPPASESTGRHGERTETRQARLRPWIGRSITAIAVLHLATAPVFYGDALHSIWQGGVVNAVLSDPAAEPLRSGGFWYLGTGLVELSLGLTVSWLGRRHDEVPRMLGWLLLGTVTYGVVLMPASGFWLLLVPATLTFLCAPPSHGAGPRPALRRARTSVYDEGGVR